jgi:hypothetical protein
MRQFHTRILADDMEGVLVLDSDLVTLKKPIQQNTTYDTA